MGGGTICKITEAWGKEKRVVGEKRDGKGPSPRLKLTSLKDRQRRGQEGIGGHDNRKDEW